MNLPNYRPSSRPAGVPARAALMSFLLAVSAAPLAAQVLPNVGPVEGGHVVPTAQYLRPAGDSIEIPGRPVDLALSRAGTHLFVKDNQGLTVIDAKAWTLLQRLPFTGDDGGSMVGIAVAPDDTVWLTTAGGKLVQAARAADGSFQWAKSFKLPAPKGSSFPCGIALSADGSTAFVCLSRNNTVAVVDLTTGNVKSQIEVGVAPYDIKLSHDGATAFVSNWGGRRATPGDAVADSGGTPAIIDTRGVAASGTLSIVDLNAGREASHIETGLSPNAVLALDDGRACVANANSDTVSFIAGGTSASVSVRPDPALPFGSMPNGLAAAADGTLFVSNAGNNCIAVLRQGTTSAADKLTPAGFIPAAWCPGSLTTDTEYLYIAAIKGVGSRTPHPPEKGWNSHWHRGVISRVRLPDDATLAGYARTAIDSARIAAAIASRAPAAAPPAGPVPIPAHPGQPSLLKHVVYIIKENRTYDQVLGDIGRGNSDPSLCVFGREVTPNQHALADEFVLLDNFYCNGVLSADGHSWATEGNVTPYLERSFGGFKRSYTFGDDPLTYSSTGFVWDHILEAGFTFRNFGEFNEAGIKPKGSYFELLEDFNGARSKYTFTQSIGVDRVRNHSHPTYPGWNMAIPDVWRASIFLDELKIYQESGTMPNFVVIYLPNDHTNGTDSDVPTPRSLVADNDVALGRIVDALSHSRFWPAMAVFVVEDDPQNGFDHVDGHRSTCYIMSPYAKRGAIVGEFYNQSSIIHTIERIFGLPAPNQLAAVAPVMSECFTLTPDLRPFVVRPNIIPLGERNPPKHSRAGEKPLDFSKPDVIDEDRLNREIWASVKGDAPYPASLAGAHGKGLAALGLRLAATGEPGAADSDDGDDDD